MDWKRIGICSTLVMTVCTEVFGATNETQESNQQMIQQIRESVNDDGFREPNYFFYDIADPYATYYVRGIKQLLGQEEGKELSDLSYSIEALENKEKSRWNLIDIYCLVMLIDDIEQLPKDLSVSIVDYLNSLYDKENGCYQYLGDFSNPTSIAPTYYAVMTLVKLREDIQPISEWISKTSESALGKEADKETYYGGYAMLYELMDAYEIPINLQDFGAVIGYYEGILNQVDEKQETALPYEMSDIPTIAMDMVKLSEHMEYSLMDCGGQILDLFGDETTFHNYLFWEYDYVNLYAIVYTLVQSELFTDEQYWINGEVLAFDQFLLDDGEYIAPGIYEGNLNATYYADELIYLLDLSVTYDAEAYCEKVLDEASDPQQIGIWKLEQIIRLLQKYQIDWESSSLKEHINVYLDEQWETILASEQWGLRELKTINQLCVLFQILNRTYNIEKSVQKKIKKQTSEYFNGQIAYDEELDLSMELMQFLINAGEKNSELVNQLSNHVDQLLAQISNQSVSFKVTLAFHAVKSLHENGYSISEEAKQSIQDMLLNAYYKNGFFCMGDVEGERVTYQSTYEAASLLQWLVGELKAGEPWGQVRWLTKCHYWLDMCPL